VTPSGPGWDEVVGKAVAIFGLEVVLIGPIAGTRTIRSNNASDGGWCG